MIAKRCSDKRTPLNYRDAVAMAVKLEVAVNFPDVEICKRVLSAEPIGVDYFRQVLELCGEWKRREEMREKASQDLLSFDAKSWKRDGRYGAFM